MTGTEGIWYVLARLWHRWRLSRAFRSRRPSQAAQDASGGIP